MFYITTFLGGLVGAPMISKYFHIVGNTVIIYVVVRSLSTFDIMKLKCFDSIVNRLKNFYHSLATFDSRKCTLTVMAKN